MEQEVITNASEQSGEQQAAQEERKPAGVGKPYAVSEPVLRDAENDSTRTNFAPEETTSQEQAAAAANETNSGEQQQATQTEEVKPSGLTPEQVKQYLAEQGIVVDNIEDLKPKEKEPEVAPELSSEQMNQQEAADYARMVQIHTEGGGTVDELNQLRSIAKMPDEQLALAVVREQLSTEGFTEAQIDNIVAEQYTQVSDEDIENMEDDAEKEYARKKNALIQKQFIAQGQAAKKKAQDYLDTLGSEIKSKDSQVNAERQVSSKVDEVLTALPKSMTLELGEADGQQLDPISFNVSDEVVEEVKGILKDPVQRNKFFYKEDGTINIENIAKVLVENKSLKAMTKVAYLEGNTRAVKAVHEVFPMQNAHDVGVGGADTGTKNTGKGKLASFGKTQVVNPSTRK